MNKMKKISTCFLALVSLVLMCGHDAHAGDAEVLPKGRFAFNVDYRHFSPWDKRFDKDGNVQDAAADFNTSLDSGIFPALSVFDGLVPGTPNIGTSVVSFKYKQDRVDTSLAYGI